MAISFTPTKIARFVGALYGVALNNSTYNAAIAEINVRGFNAVANEVFAADFGSKTTTQVAQIVAQNAGLTGQASADAVTYITGQLNAAAADARGAVIISIMNQYAGLTSDATFGAAATAFEGRVANAVNYSLAASSVQHGAFADLSAGTVLNLVTGFDNLTGTTGDDVFTATSVGGANTLNDGDVLKGGAGTDTLNADLINLGHVITPSTSGVEIVNIRAENDGWDSAQNNTNGQGVTVDAERMADVTTWSSTNSRADLIVEDVRINSNVSTIAFVQSDPGNVDLAVYFNERNLVNTVGSSSVLNIQVMDTGAAANNATAATPLLNNPYDTFKFAANGQMITLALPNAAAADTYAQLLAAFQSAIAANPALTGVTAGLGANFTVTDPLSGKQVTGQTITLTAGTAVAITTPTGSGWFNTTGASVPASSNMYTTYNNAQSSQAALVSTNVILDDVGLGDTGGDLLIGGMSTGITSNDKGVELFNIEVRDNSKLQTINSTNNTLREVYITNGKTSSSSTAYVTTTTDAGDLTVNGNAKNSLGVDQGAGGSNNTLAGANEGASVNHQGANAAGFTDVRVIDASAMKGKFAFTAAISSDSIAKYVNVVDTQANPAGDIATNNTTGLGANFVYTGGTNNDTMTVTIDGNVAGSRSTVVSGQSDFTFNVNGGAGNDAITLSVLGSGLAGGAQAWYNNQKLNANISIDAGDGNDTIRTPGAGDVIINAGAGDDTVYTDNTGALSTAQANGAASAIAVAMSNDSAAELAAGNAAAVASNSTGFVRVSGTEAGGSAFVTTAAAAAALDVLNLVTPVTYDALTAPTYATLQTAIDTAVAAGGLSFAQAIALETAYQTMTVASTVTPATTLANQVKTAGTAHAAGVISAADFAAGNALLDTYITAAKAAAAAATANDTNWLTHTAALNGTQNAVVAATQAVNRVADFSTASTETAVVTWAAFAANGTQTIGGMTITNASGGAVTANNVALVAGGGVVAGVTITTPPSAWTVAAGVGATNVFTSNTANANVADVDAVAPSFTGAGNAAPTAVTTQGVNAVSAGTQTTVNNLATLNTALAVGATDAQVVTALQTAIDNGAITAAQAATLFGAATSVAPGTIDAAELITLQANLVPIQTAAANANTAAQTALTNAIAADNVVVNAASTAAAATPAAITAQVGLDQAEATAAAAAVTAFNTGTLAPLQAQAAGLAALKSAITVGTTDLAVVTATANAVAAGTINGANKIAIDAAASAVTGTVGVPVTAAEKIAVDVLITALQLTNETALADATLDLANLQAISDAAATALANSQAAAASGANSLSVAAPRAVYVFNTSNQAASYNRVTMDDRNLADLKSDANNSHNFFNSTVKVTYKGIDASVVVAGTGYKTTDLEINQAIKQAINTDAVLSKLLLATDGPGNSLVVTSLIDGAHTTGNLAVSVTLPTALTLAEATAAAAAYGMAVGSTDAQVLATMTTAKTAFDTKGDYTTQFAESGAAGGNVTLVGANSTSSSDNTVTPGAGKDVIVLGTTVGTDLMTSSNEIVKYAADFGNDTIVNFAATGLGIDQLDFSALGGRGAAAFNSFSANQSVVVAAQAVTPLTTAQIAALFTDSATAATHVYVAYDTNNVGSVYAVTDAAGTAAGNVTATLVGTIDLADTGWATLTAANFA